jgi:hypothetical protein
MEKTWRVELRTTKNFGCSKNEEKGWCWRDFMQKNMEKVWKHEDESLSILVEALYMQKIISELTTGNWKVGLCGESLCRRQTAVSHI